MGCSASKEAAVESNPPRSATSQPTQSNIVNSQRTTSGSVASVASSPHIANYAAHVLDNGATTKTKTTDGDTGYSSDTTGSALDSSRPRFASYASGASTPDDYNSDDGSHASGGSGSGSGSGRFGHIHLSNPKLIQHSTSQIGLDEMMEERREAGDLRQNVVHIEVPFGRPIEEVYDGVHSGPVLGSGISGLVRLVTHKATGLKYAVKVLDLGLVDTAEGLKQLREEIFIMCQLDHPNIVRLEEVYESHSEIYLVQELCLGGELFDRLDEQPDYHYTEAECARLVKQMLSAVRYLHSKGIIHRDLKLENFLFTNTTATSELKMIDFGLSKHFRYGEVQHEAVGTPYTVAPEVIRGSYDERCDIWAIGVITFLLLSGDPPFGGCGGPESLMVVRSNILKGAFEFEPEDIWAHVSKMAREFIRDMLVTDPKKRPLARTAQKHAWLQEWANRNRKGDDNIISPNVVKALVNFKEFSDMRKLLCEVLSFTLLPDQIKELRHEFEKMDTDGSGEISLSALKQVLMANAGAGSLGALTEEEVEDIFNAMRVKKSETRIHWHEFIAAGLSQCQVDDRNLRLAFERLDSDHKGYITLDDIMDLMGSDAVQSEDAMREMWGDSIKSVKCQSARITFGDFLLLMKGQGHGHTKEVPGDVKPTSALTLPSILTAPSMLGAVPGSLEMSALSFVGRSTMLNVVHEGVSTSDQDHDEEEGGITPPSDDKVTNGGLINGSDLLEKMDDSTHTPVRYVIPSKSAPSTPADHHRNVVDMEQMESPLSMDEDDDNDNDITSSGPGVPGSLASLTPPTSPLRGAHDYFTPMSGHRGLAMELRSDKLEGLMVPGLALAEKPPPYTRRRSKSVDDQDAEAKPEDLMAVAEVVRDLMLPETDHEHAIRIGNAKDESQSALVVNRKLYRTHRQMRMAVLEASKRFEEQQAAHAKEVILAQREEAEGKTEPGLGMIQAGLVMRHGHKGQVSSEAIRSMLKENRVQQQALVEKATRRGGRGRRSRKKTISDMSAMMNSMGQDEMGSIAMSAALEPPVLEAAKTLSAKHILDAANGPDLDPDVEGDLRGATVPGEFRKTRDPFSNEGLYGTINDDL